MKDYLVRIVETCSKTVRIKAESTEQAYNIVEKAVNKTFDISLLDGEIEERNIYAFLPKDEDLSLYEEFVPRDKEKELETLKERIKKIIVENFNPDRNGKIEIYTDYRDSELSNSFLHEIMTSDTPRQVFEDKLSEWADDYSCEYGFTELYREIKKNLSEEDNFILEENEEDIDDFIKENFYFYYDENDFNNEVKVNIMLDTGDKNYDFTKNNILNYYASWYGEAGEFDEESSILWLAKQMGKEKELREACSRQYREDGYYVEREIEEDPFVESVIQELENLTCQMSTLTFLVKMNLFAYFNIREAIASEKEKNKSYIYEERKGTGYITVNEDTMCGLFNPWSGGGSVLGIELDKPVKIPFKAIFAAEIETGKSQYGYSVDNVYGLCGSAWKDTLEEIKESEG